MDIPIGVAVECTDGTCGRTTHVIVDPTKNAVTHVVVEDNRDYQERLVPTTLLTETTPQKVHLRCSRQELNKLAPFIETEFVDTATIGMMLWPYDMPVVPVVTVKHELVPKDEMAVGRGADVLATDGRVGQVDEFLIDPTSGGITHLVLREGHLWGQKDVTIPVSAITKMDHDTVHLKMDKASIGQLPSIPVKRRSFWSPREP